MIGPYPSQLSSSCTIWNQGSRHVYDR